MPSSEQGDKQALKRALPNSPFKVSRTYLPLFVAHKPGIFFRTAFFRRVQCTLLAVSLASWAINNVFLIHFCKFFQIKHWSGSFIGGENTFFNKLQNL